MSELPDGWAEVKLGELAKPEYGKGLRQADRSEGGSVPVYGSAGVVGYHDSALIDTPALIVGRKGNAGSVYISTGPSWPIDTTYFLRLPSGLDPHFVAHYLSVAELGVLDSSTAIPSLRRHDLEAQRVRVPPSREQQRIVSALEEHFSRLDAAERFLQRARQRLNSLRAASLAAALDGWPEHALGEISKVYVGTTPSRRIPELWGGGVPWVSSGEVEFCRIRQSRETISQDAVTSPDRLHPPGTVLLAMIGEGKTRGQAAILDVAAAHNQNSAAIRLDPSLCTPEWLFYVLMARYEETRRAGSGAQQPALNRSRVEALKLPLPPLDEQRRIVAEVEQQLSIVDAMAVQVDAALRRSKALRRAILEQAFTGKLVRQDPADEPASVLLERIAAERAPAEGNPPSRRAKAAR